MCLMTGVTPWDSELSVIGKIRQLKNFFLHRGTDLDRVNPTEQRQNAPADPNRTSSGHQHFEANLKHSFITNSAVKPGFRHRL